MKRTVGVGLVVLFAAALLAATASGQGNEPVTISIWGGWGHFEDATLPKVIEAFEKAHPHIRVERRQITGDMEGLMVQLIGGVAPDRSSAPLGAISSGFFRAESQLPCHAVTRV